jgi:hypothetical protein
MGHCALKYIPKPKQDVSVSTTSSPPISLRPSESTLMEEVKNLIFAANGTGLVLFVLIMKQIGAFTDVTTSVSVDKKV